MTEQTVRDSFVEWFSEADAALLTEAVVAHQGERNTIIDILSGDDPATTEHSEDSWGSQPFRYVVLAVISFECISHRGYRAHHGLDIDPERFYTWVEQHAGLDQFDGDQPDHLTAMMMAAGQMTALDVLRWNIDRQKGTTL